MSENEQECSPSQESQYSINPFLIPEILEIIVRYMDGASLAQAEQVCTLWRDVVKGLAEEKKKPGLFSTAYYSFNQKPSVWRTCCEREIPRETRIDLLNACEPSWFDPDFRKDWKMVYKHWHLWRNVRRWPFLTRSVMEYKQEPVSCVKMTGNLVITGHIDGRITAWSYERSWDVARHKKAITDFGVMIKAIHVDKDKFRRHEFVVSTSLDHNIQINMIVADPVREYDFPMTIREHNTAIMLVRTFADIFVVLEEDFKITVWQLTFRTIKGLPEVLKRHTVRLTHLVEDISVFGAKTIEVTAVTRGGHSIPVYSKGGPMYYELSSRRSDYFLHAKERETIEGRILRVFMCKKGISIILTDRHYMYVRMPNHKQVKYNTMPYLHTYPVVVKLYAEILLLGTESGMLYMYHLKDVSELLNLNFSEPYWKCSALTDPIIALDITESATAPKLVAATRDKVVSISFLPDWYQK